MRRYVLAVSLIHLLFLAAYVKLGGIAPWRVVDSVYGDGSVFTVTMLSAASAPFLVGALLWITDSFLRRSSKPWIGWTRESVFVVLGIVALLSVANAIRIGDARIRGPVDSFISEHLFILGVAFLASLVLLVVSVSSATVRQRLVRFLGTALYLLAPTVLLSTAGVFYVLVRADPPESSGSVLGTATHAPVAPGLPKATVVILFDAFSYNIAFSNYEVDERLPNLRALTEESLVFHNVLSAPGATGENVPMILTGETYFDFDKDPQLGEVAYLADGTEVVLKDQSNLFDLAQEQDYRVVVLGTEIRYCSTYVRQNAYCRSTPFDFNVPQTQLKAFVEPYRLASAVAVPYAAKEELQGVLGDTTLFGFLDGPNNTLSRTGEMQNTVLTLLRDPNGLFVYAHYMIPHDPYVRYNKSNGRLQFASTYFDSLQAVDSFLGEIRQTLEASGMWDDTLLVVLSDHNDEDATDDERVPLIVKLPDMKRRLDYQGPWTQAQLLPLLRELYDRRSFDPETAADIVRTLTAPIDHQPTADDARGEHARRVTEHDRD